jgi:hypothetical protein
MLGRLAHDALASWQLRDDRVTRALFRPHRILQPLDLTTARP